MTRAALRRLGVDATAHRHGRARRERRHATVCRRLFSTPTDASMPVTWPGGTDLFLTPR